MYTIELTKPARKAFLKLPDKVRQLIYEKLNKLAQNPYTSHNDVKQLQGMKGCYRLRVGEWRVVYRLNNDVLIIEIIKIGHRKEIYR